MCGEVQACLVQEEEQEEVLDKHIFRWDTTKCVEKYKPASFYTLGLLVLHGLEVG